MKDFLGDELGFDMEDVEEAVRLQEVIDMLFDNLVQSYKSKKFKSDANVNELLQNIKQPENFSVYLESKLVRDYIELLMEQMKVKFTRIQLDLVEIYMVTWGIYVAQDGRNLESKEPILVTEQEYEAYLVENSRYIRDKTVAVIKQVEPGRNLYDAMKKKERAWESMSMENLDSEDFKIIQMYYDSFEKEARSFFAMSETISIIADFIGQPVLNELIAKDNWGEQIESIVEINRNLIKLFDENPPVSEKKKCIVNSFKKHTLEYDFNIESLKPEASKVEKARELLNSRGFELFWTREIRGLHGIMTKKL